jgi:hypothetical protein
MKMIKKFYAIMDTTAKAFLNPLEAKNHGDAIRLFTTFVNGDKEQSNIARYPQQFTLFHMFDMDDKTGVVGTYDDAQDKMQPQQTPHELMNGAMCVEEENLRYTTKQLIQLIKNAAETENVVDFQNVGGNN